MSGEKSKEKKGQRRQSTAPAQVESRVEEVDRETETQVWQLIGTDNETSQKRDELVRQSFRYLQAPSTSLCLSILDLHDQSLECGKFLLNMCDELSNHLHQLSPSASCAFTAASQSCGEDFALIINMIKNLLNNAKMKLLQNSVNITFWRLIRTMHLLVLIKLLLRAKFLVFLD